MSKQDYYQTLEVGKGANADEIKAAYRKQAIKYHPDKNPGDKAAEEKFKLANEAYSVLSDPEKRRMYDQFGHAAVDGSAGAPGGGFRGGQGFEGFGGLGDIFGDLFEEAFSSGRRRSGGNQPGHDLRVDKEVTLAEVLTGVDVTLDVPNYQACEVCSGSGARTGTGQKKCPDCQGKGQVRISQGFFTMAQTCGRCRGFGQIIENPCASCSGSGRVHRSRKVKVRIPPGVENGTTLRISGAGEAGERGGPPGDLYVVVRVAQDRRFERDGANLFRDQSISFPMAAPAGLAHAVTAYFSPLFEFFRRKGALVVLTFVLVHKIGDTLANLTLRLLFNDLGFSNDEIAFYDVGVGFVALLAGVFAGGALYAALGMKRTVLISLVLMAVSNFSFAALAAYGHSNLGMAGAIGFENFASGLGGVAVVAYFSALCNLRFTATQYALLSALASIAGRFLTGATAGGLIEQMGYVNFYLLTTLIAFPGVVLYWFMIRSGLADVSLGSAGKAD